MRILKRTRMIEMFKCYSGQYRGLHFKPSSLKGNGWLSFLPVNLHIQSFLVMSYYPSAASKQIASNLSLSMLLNSQTLRSSFLASTSIFASINNSPITERNKFVDKRTMSDTEGEYESDSEAIGATERRISSTTVNFRYLDHQNALVPNNVRISSLKMDQATKNAPIHVTGHAPPMSKSMSSPPGRPLPVPLHMQSGIPPISPPGPPIRVQSLNNGLTAGGTLSPLVSPQNLRCTLSPLTRHQADSPFIPPLMPPLPLSPVAPYADYQTIQIGALSTKACLSRTKSQDYVSRTASSSQTDVNIAENTVNCFHSSELTVGAFSAHHFKYHAGGVTQGMSHYDKLLKQYPNETDALLNDVEHFQQQLQFRKESVFSQALTSCVTIFVQQIVKILQKQPSIVERFAVLGFLFHSESLLSTFGDEIAMLSDHNFSVYFLRSVHFALRRKPPGKKYDFDSNAFVSSDLTVHNSSEIIANQIPLHDWNTVGSNRLQSKAAYLDSSIPHVIDFNLHDIVPVLRPLKFTEQNILHSKNSLGAGRPMDALVDDFSSVDYRFVAFPPSLVVDIFLPNSLFEALPVTMQHPLDLMLPKDSPSSLRASERLIQVVPILFSQGVNEMQTIANASRSDTEQYEINVYYLELLKGYVTRVKEFALKKSDSSLGAILPAILEDMVRLETIIHKSRGIKCLELLTLADSITRRLDAGRAISCKSAKDRTSMSITWQNGKRLTADFGVSEDVSVSMIETMRMEGVRRANVLKNTGKALFAFNALQRSMHPVELQAPQSCCGSTES